MTRPLIRREALTRELSATPELERRLDKLGLLVPVARGGRRGPLYYDAHARGLVERAVALTAAGYAPKDIAHVLGRVERTPPGPLVEVLGLVPLAGAAKLPVERVSTWVARGLIAPWGADEIGTALFLRSALGDVRGLAALETLGLGELALAWVDGSFDVALVKARVAEAQAAARLLAQLAPKKAAARRVGTPRVRAKTARVKRPTRA